MSAGCEPHAGTPVELGRTQWRPWLRASPLVCVIAVGCVALCIALAQHGPVMFWDASSYAAGADSVARGHGLTTQMVPTFSNYSPVEFIERGGRVPFTDFPAGFTLVTGIIAIATGARQAMMVVAFASTGILVIALLHGVRTTHRRLRETSTADRWTIAAIVCFAIGVVLFPSYQWMLRAGLSEPAFCAVVLSVAALLVVGDRHHLPLAVVLSGIAGCIRFVGLPIIAVSALLLWRDRGHRRTWGWVLAAIAPTVANVLWSSAVGSGHRFGLRDLSLSDVRIALHAIVGWVSNHYGGGLALFYGESWPVWWGFVLAIVWLAGVVVALVGEARGRSLMPRPMQVTLAMAGVLVGSLFVGMLLFDSFVQPDNRLLMPAGLLTITGLVWSAAERFDGRWVLAGVLVWIALACEPWSLRAQDEPMARPDLIAAVGDARIVVSDDSDGVWWETGVPAAALPTASSWLTGEANDQTGELLRLPCVLHAEGGVNVVTAGPFMDQAWTQRLEPFVDSGELTEQRFGTVLRFTPTGTGCS